MPSVLGIDAAWTLTQPSGLAVVTKRASQWCLVAVESSYQRFLALADETLTDETRPTGSQPKADFLLAATATLSGHQPDLVAVDMPLAHSPIVRRRFSDNAVSKDYATRKCGTHSPSAARPGLISDIFREDFAAAGYLLQTETLKAPGLIEVYPHPAIVELMRAPERLPYKASKVAVYWPNIGMSERRCRLYQQWVEIIAALDEQISGVRESLPSLASDAKRSEMKAYEDKLDAIVCAWVGICALEGRAKPFGDRDSAIWIPSPRDELSEANGPG